MINLVAYDIADSRRLRKVWRICRDYGYAVEKSVFECNLTANRFEKMWEELKSVIDNQNDSLIAYPLCGECAKKIRSAGQIRRIDKPEIYIL